MSSSKNYSDPFYDGESPLTPVSEWPLEKLIATGLQRRQMGLPAQPFQKNEMAAFDMADLEEKARMLGPLWPKWHHLFEPPASRLSH